MANYEILKNGSLLVDLPLDFSNQGWVVSENIAYHSGCNGGYIDKYFDLSSQPEWTFRYRIGSVTSGAINIVVDGESGVSRTSAGTYEDTFTVTGTNVLVRFYSEGVNNVELLQIYSEENYVGGLTLAFNEDADKWVTYLSYVPEMMLKFLDGFFTFKEGELWEHNVNEIRNNFFGEQYTSKIVFYCNIDPTAIKQFHSMRQKSNKVWSVPELLIYPYYGKPEGQVSRLKKGRFKSLQGDFFADILRDLNDPRFTPDVALFQGAEMQGSLMRVTIENNDTVEVRLLCVNIDVSLSQFTY